MGPRPTNGENNMWVQAIVDPKLYPKQPGGIIRLWGHKFEIQIDHTLCMDMHSDFVATEVRSGRVTKMTSPPPGKDKEIAKKIIIKQDPPVGFTMDVGNYYGAGDLDTLFERITKMKNKEIVGFAVERFPDKEKLKANMKSKDMVDKIRSYVDSAIIAYNEED
jgi:hypothetical protein